MMQFWLINVVPLELGRVVLTRTTKLMKFQPINVVSLELGLIVLMRTTKLSCLSL